MSGFKLKTIYRQDAWVRGVLKIRIIVVIHVEIFWESTTCVGRDSPLSWLPECRGCQGGEVSQVRRDGTCRERVHPKLVRER